MATKLGTDGQAQCITPRLAHGASSQVNSQHISKRPDREPALPPPQTETLWVTLCGQGHLNKCGMLPCTTIGTCPGLSLENTERVLTTPTSQEKSQYPPKSHICSLSISGYQGSLAGLKAMDSPTQGVSFPNPFGPMAGPPDAGMAALLSSPPV